MRNDRDWIPDATDVDSIESIAPAVPPAALATATILPVGDGLLIASWRGASA